MASQKAVKGEGIRPSPAKGLCPIVQAGDYVFLRGETGKDPATGKIVSGGVQEQARQILTNVGTMLKAAGGSLNDVVAATVYLVNLEDFKAMNEVWSEFFADTDPGPARTTVGVAQLGGDAVVEIQSIAYLK